MARIEVKTAYRVSFTEYERGWGQKEWSTEYYDNAEEAKAVADAYNKEHNNKDYVPDWYVIARYEGATR
jgi:hypothetical protein